MHVSFRTVKDIAALPLHHLLRMTPHMPEFMRRLIIDGSISLARQYYFFPRSHVRKCVTNLCTVIGRSDPLWITDRLFGNLALTLRLAGQLLNEGGAAVAEHMTVPPDSLARIEAMHAAYGAGIFVVPHCAGSVLAAAKIGQIMPSVIMARESKSPLRKRILRQYLARLGPDIIETRGTPPATIARRILTALRQKKVVIGTTDLIRKTDDTVEVTVFGRKAWMPAWPARFAARRKTPILPGYIHIRNGRFILTCGDPYCESDTTRSTQRWVAYFEQAICRWPEDWLFVFEKRWARLLAEAAVHQSTELG
jgi:lauroyl/myristoyl acyltransferase